MPPSLTEGLFMIQLNLTTEEEQVLRDELKVRLTELDLEIVHTDRFEFKNMLKSRRDQLRKVYYKVTETAPGPWPSYPWMSVQGFSRI